MDKKLTSEDMEKRDRVNKRMFETEYKALNKYFYEQAYLMLDKNLRLHKEQIKKAKMPAFALAYIKASQTPLILYLEKRSRYRRDLAIEYPERLYENKDYEKFEDIVRERGSYSQVKDLMPCIGTNVVKTGLQMYITGKAEGISDETIMKDLKTKLHSRRMADCDLVEFAAYPNMKMLDQNIDKVKQQIQEAIVEYRSNEAGVQSEIKD